MDVDVKKIIECVGGKSNIVSHTHCMTRLRFILADKSLVQDDDVKKIKGVINSLYAGDQYQIVIGPNAQEVYNNLVKELQNDTAASDLMQQENNVKENSLFDFAGYHFICFHANFRAFGRFWNFERPCFITNGYRRIG